MIADILLKSGEYAPPVQAILDLDKKYIITPDLGKDFFYLCEDFPTFNIMNVPLKDGSERITKHAYLFASYKETLNKDISYRAVLAKNYSQIWKFTSSAVYYQKWGYTRFDTNKEIFGGMLFSKTVCIGLCRYTRVIENIGGYTGLLYAFPKDDGDYVLTPKGLINLGKVDKVDMSKLEYSLFAKLPENIYGLYIKNDEVKYLDLGG